MKSTQNAIIRLVIAALAMINAILTAAGMNPIPFDATLVTEWLTYAFNGAMLIWAWWKNAPMTEAAQEAQTYMKAIKEDGKEEE